MGNAISLATLAISYFHPLAPSPSSIHHPISSSEVFHTALLLRRKLVGDLIPLILDYSSYWIRFSFSSTAHVRVNPASAGYIYLQAVIPAYVPRTAVRRVKFIVTSRDQGWSSYPEDHGTYRGSWSWFDVVVVEDGLAHEHVTYLEEGEDDDEERGEEPKRLITNVHAGVEYETHVVEWRRDDEDLEIREKVKRLKGGDVICLRAWARYPGWMNDVKDAWIDIDVAAVRRMQ